MYPRQWVPLHVSVLACQVLYGRAFHDGNERCGKVYVVPLDFNWVLGLKVCVRVVGCIGETGAVEQQGTMERGVDYIDRLLLWHKSNQSLIYLVEIMYANVCIEILRVRTSKF